jgi:hypothetical protein
MIGRFGITLLLLTAASIALPTIAKAFTITWPQTWDYVPYTTAGGGRTDLNPLYPSLSTEAERQTLADLIEEGWPEYYPVLTEDFLPGTATVSEYKAKHYLTGDPAIVYRAGAKIVWDYETTDPILDELRYVQVVWTNDRQLPHTTSPYIDGQGGEMYYFNDYYEGITHYGDEYTFFDDPYRSYTGVEAKYWRAATFLVQTIAEQVVIYDGVTWGWATVGTSEWENPGDNAPVPEPASVFGLILPILLFRRLKRK